VAIATCKETLVIPINKVVDKKRIMEKRRADEEEGHKGSLTPQALSTFGNVAFWSRDGR
jgi:hypothetical protein